MKTQSAFIATDWNNRETEFVVGDRILFHDDDGQLFRGVVTGLEFSTATLSDGSLKISFDDGEEGWESPKNCELANFQ